MGATINATDILQTIANNITGSTLSSGSETDGGSTSKGQELNAYAKAYKIISDNSTYINSKSGTDTATGDLIEEIFFSHQPAAATPYTTGTGGSYGGTGNDVVQGNNYANGFNALFIANAIDQLRQVDSVASDSASIDPSRNSVGYSITQSQATGAMTLSLLDKEGSTPTATSSINLDFRIKSGTAAASLILGQGEIGTAISSTTLELPSGATLGMTNDVEETVYIYAINNAGTIELAVITNQRLDESILHSTTAIDGTADSSSTLYSTSARSDVAVRLIGRMRITRNDNTTFDEDPTELSIVGVNGSVSSGELAKDEKIYFYDSSKYIFGDTSSLTVNSDQKVDVVAPTVNVVASSTANIDTPQVDFTGNVSITGTSSHLTIGTTDVTSGYHLDISNTAPIFRIKNTDTATTDEAKRSRFEVESDDGITMFQMDVKHDGAADDDKTKVIFSNRGTSSLTAFLTANSSQGVSLSGNLSVTGSLTVSGTTTTVDSTITQLVDPIFEIGGGAGGATLSADDNKDRGILFHYHDGTSAVDGFMGWDDSASEIVMVADGSLSSEVLTASTYANVRLGDLAVTGTLTESSDRSLKTNVRDLDNPLSKVMALRGVEFDWKGGESNQIGLIADEVEEILPTLVKRDSNNLASLQYSKMVALLIEGMKEQQKKIEELEDKLSNVHLV